MAEKNYHSYAPKEAELLAKVGLAMTLWARVEYQLMELGAWALQKPVQEAAKKYARFRTFSQALSHTEESCKDRLEDVIYLESLTDLIREIAKDRNFLGHNSVVAHTPGHPDEVDWADAIPKIGPSMSHYFQAAADKREPMDVEEVNEVTLDMQFLVEEIEQYTSALCEGAFPDRFKSELKPRRPRLAERKRTENA